MREMQIGGRDERNAQPLKAQPGDSRRHRHHPSHGHVARIHQHDAGQQRREGATDIAQQVVRQDINQQGEGQDDRRRRQN